MTDTNRSMAEIADALGMTRPDTKRSNAEIADKLELQVRAGLYSSQTDREILEAAAALREPITFSDAAVEAAAKAYAYTLPAFGNESYYAMLKSARAAVEAAIAVHNKERENHE